MFDRKFHCLSFFLIAFFALNSASAQEEVPLLEEDTPLFDGQEGEGDSKDESPNTPESNRKEQLEEIANIRIDDVIADSVAAWRRPIIPADFPLPGMEMEITSDDPRASEHIIAGMHFLHLSWDQEALRHFVAALRLDSRAPLAWWGVVMSLLPEQNEFMQQRDMALAKLTVLRDRCEHEWEKELIDAISIFVVQGPEGTIKKLDELLKLKPNDLNAQLLKVNFLRGGHYLDGQPKPSLQQAQRLVWKLSQEYENHPLVLRYEMGVRFPAPQKALPQASAVLTEISPALRSPWLYYEAAQLAYALGFYERSRKLCELGKNRIYGWITEANANLEDTPMLAKLTELEVYALLELGQVKLATRIAKEASEFQIKDSERKESAGYLSLVHHASILPSAIEERFGNWQAAYDKLPEVKGDFETELAPWVWEARRIYYIGEMKAQEGDLEGLRQAHFTLNELGAAYQNVANRVARNMGALEHWHRQQLIIHQHLHFLYSRSAELQGDQNLAILQLRNALERREAGLRRPPPLTPRQPRQQLGLVALQWGDANLARRAFNQALQNASVNQATAWLGLAESFHALRDSRAPQALEQFEIAWANADRDHPLLLPFWNRAAKLKSELGLAKPTSKTSTTPVSANP